MSERVFSRKQAVELLREELNDLSMEGFAALADELEALAEQIEAMEPVTWTTIERGQLREPHALSKQDAEALCMEDEDVVPLYAWPAEEAPDGL